MIKADTKVDVALNTEAPAEGASDSSREYPEIRLDLQQPFTYVSSITGKKEEVKSIDLSGISDLDAKTMAEIDLEMFRRGYAGMRMEVTRQYAMLVAAKLNAKPYGWLDEMKARDVIRLKEIVATYFFVKG